MGLLTRKSAAPSSTQPPQEHIDTLLQELRATLPVETLSALITTGETPQDDDAHIEAMLLRYLTAEKFDVHNARSRLTKQAKWRLKTLPKGFMSDEEAEEGLAHNKVMLQRPVSSDNTDGASSSRPLLIVYGARHLPTDLQTCENFIIYCLETAAQLCCNTSSKGNDGKLVALMDLKGLKWQNLDATALKSCFSVLNSHYPERVLRIYMLDAPVIFDGLWRVVSPFIDPVSRAKVRFIYSPSGHKKLLEYVDPAILPQQYGGTADVVPVRVVADEVRRERQADKEKKEQREERREVTEGGKNVEAGGGEENSEDTFFDL